MKNKKTKSSKAKKIKTVKAWQETAAKLLGILLQFASIYALIVGLVGWLMPLFKNLFQDFISLCPSYRF
ncbi:hypothetical protein ICE98_00502 [Lactococcus lactis]|nr:hypothetical protein [Lactococcus lactis]